MAYAIGGFHQWGFMGIHGDLLDGKYILCLMHYKWCSMVSIVMGVPQYLDGLQWKIHLYMADLEVPSGQHTESYRKIGYLWLIYPSKMVIFQYCWNYMTY